MSNGDIGKSTVEGMEETTKYHFDVNFYFSLTWTPKDVGEEIDKMFRMLEKMQQLMKTFSDFDGYIDIHPEEYCVGKGCIQSNG